MTTTLSRPPPGPVLLLLAVVLAMLPAAAEAEVQPAPWSGIVGFLRMVARLQQRQEDPPEPELAEDPDGGAPLRKIVYAVEEQASGGEAEIRSTGSAIVFDSARDSPTPVAGDSDGGKGRARRSTETEAEATARQAAAATRPFLIGRKLWYVPLWFSIYLILYVTALTVKSVARHRIKYPTLLSEEDVLAKRRNGLLKSDIYTRRVTNAIANGERKYQQSWSM